MLHEYYRRPLDAWSMTVTCAFVLRDEYQVLEKFDCRGRASRVQCMDGVFQPCGLTAAAMRNRIGNFVGDEAALPANVLEALTAMEHPGLPAYIDSLLAVIVVEPVAKLIMKNAWSDVIMLARWPLSAALSAGMCLERALACKGHFESTDQSLFPLSLDMYTSLIEHLRGWICEGQE